MTTKNNHVSVGGIVDFQYIGGRNLGFLIKEYSIRLFNEETMEILLDRSGKISLRANQINFKAYDSAIELHGLNYYIGYSFGNFLEDMKDVMAFKPVKFIAFGHNKINTLKQIYSTHFQTLKQPEFINLEYPPFNIKYKKIINAPDSFNIAPCAGSNETHKIRCSEKNVNILYNRILRDKIDSLKTKEYSCHPAPKDIHQRLLKEPCVTGQQTMMNN
ncbi:MAG: hypothetical protein ACRYGG_03825 [Janthinobacterium lividum]